MEEDICWGDRRLSPHMCFQPLSEPLSSSPMMTRSAQLKKRATINETPLNSDTEPLDDKIDVQARR